MSTLLHSNATPAALGIARFAVYAVWFLLVWLHPVQDFAALPHAWFDPVGVMRLVPEGIVPLLLTSETLTALRVTVLILCGLLALGIRPFRPLALACAVLVLLLDAIVKGYGSFVNHAETTAMIAVWVLAFFPASDGFSILNLWNNARKKSPLAPEPSGANPARGHSNAMYAAPLVFTGLCISITYMILGIRRFAHGGYEIFTGDAILRYFSVNSLNYSPFGFEHGLVFVEHPLLGIFARVAFFVVTLAELAAPLALFHRTFRWIWLAVMLPMHLGTLFLMNIIFWEQMVMVLVFMTGLTHVLSSEKLRGTGRIQSMAASS